MLNTGKKDQEKRYLYWLSHIPGIGRITVQRLWEHYGGFEVLYNIEGKELEAENG